MNGKITIVFLIGIFIISSYFIFLSGTLNKEQISSSIKVSAIYFAGKKMVEISYHDTTNMTRSVLLEVEGLSPVFSKKFTTSSFKEEISLSQPPQFGWKSIPITFDVDHLEFGKLLLKTEIHLPEEPQGEIVYGRP